MGLAAKGIYGTGSQYAQLQDAETLEEKEEYYYNMGKGAANVAEGFGLTIVGAKGIQAAKTSAYAARTAALEAAKVTVETEIKTTEKAMAGTAMGAATVGAVADNMLTEYEMREETNERLKYLQDNEKMEDWIEILEYNKQQKIDRTKNNGNEDMIASIEASWDMTIKEAKK